MFQVSPTQLTSSFDITNHKKKIQFYLFYKLHVPPVLQPMFGSWAKQVRNSNTIHMHLRISLNVFYMVVIWHLMPTVLSSSFNTVAIGHSHERSSKESKHFKRPLELLSS